MRNEKRPMITDTGFLFDGRSWSFDTDHPARIVLNNDVSLYFNDARRIEKTPYTSGLGEGIRVRYTGFGNDAELSFETQMLVDSTTGYVDCTFIPLKLGGLSIK